MASSSAATTSSVSLECSSDSEVTEIESEETIVVSSLLDRLKSPAPAVIARPRKIKRTILPEVNADVKAALPLIPKV